jgi:hypothetical protein
MQRFVWLILVAGCGSTPATKATPPVTSPSAEEAETEPAPTHEVKWVEDCVARFRDKPPTLKETAAGDAQPLVEQGDAVFVKTKTLRHPAGVVAGYLESVEKYSAALRTYPYNAKATLGLALAYDGLRRKGCALALLKRLGYLQTAPHLDDRVFAAIIKVEQDPAMFAGYRREALGAHGDDLLDEPAISKQEFVEAVDITYALTRVDIPDPPRLPSIPEPVDPNAATPAKAAPKAAKTEWRSIKLAGLTSSGAKTKLTLKVSQPLTVGMRGMLVGEKNVIPGSSFKVERVTSDAAFATINLELKSVEAAKRAVVAVE